MVKKKSSMEWVSFWLDNMDLPDPNTPLPVPNASLPAPPIAVVIQDTMKHDDQPQSSLKQKPKNGVSREEGPRSRYIDLVCHPEGQAEGKEHAIEEGHTKVEEHAKVEEDAEDQEHAKRIDHSVQRRVNCHDVGALKAPKRPFDETLDRRDISNSVPGPRPKAPRVTLTDNKRKTNALKGTSKFMPFYGPPLASQPVSAKDRVKPKVPECNIHWEWVSNRNKRSLIQ